MPEDPAGQAGEPVETSEPALEDRLAALEAQNAGLIRERAFAQVLPADVLATPVGQFFTESYQGELGMAQIREKAIELNLIADPNAGTDPAAQAGTATEGERQAFEQAREMAAGGIAPGTDPGPEPRILARETADAVRKTGTTDEALGAYFASVVSSAAGGDRRGTIDLARQYFGSGRQPSNA